MVVVAAFSFLFALILLFLYSQIPPGFEEIKRFLTIGILIQVALCGMFVGCFFWAKASPLPATLTALIIYLTLMLITLAMDPKSFLNPFALTFRVLITLALLYGVKSAVAYSRMEAEDERYTRREGRYQRRPTGRTGLYSRGAPRYERR
jgi:drug/metabolite transporter (DMT)-like permease